MSVTSATSLDASADLVTAPNDIVVGVVGAAANDPAAQPTHPLSLASRRFVIDVAPVVLAVAVLVPLALVSASFVAWACLGAWSAAQVVRALRARRPADLSSLARADVRTALALAFVLALVAVADGVPTVDARWGLGVLAAAAAATVTARGILPRRPSTRRVVLVGSHQDVTTYCSSLDGADVVVAACYVDEGGPALSVPSGDVVPAIEGVDGLPELVSRVRGDLVLVLPGPDTTPSDVRRLTWALEGSPAGVGVLTPVAAVGRHRLAASDLNDRTFLELAPVGASALESRLKGLVDRLGAAVLLLVLSPLMLALLVWVRLDSKGSGLFVQTRVGRGGEAFQMYKLRTMYVDAEAMKQALIADNDADGVLFKIRRDPRVTRLGYWLRRMSLDELPQLLNVLRGEMSLIGPRPALPSEVAAYGTDAHRRLAVKPGITGLWQVSGRSDLLWDDALRLDLYYADNWRLVDDVAIAARTVSAVATGRGAY